MAHRIAKKQHQSRQQPQPQNTQSQSQPQYYQSEQQQSPQGSRLPRPLLAPSSTITAVDKFAYRQGKPGFPMPQSLYQCSSTYDASCSFIRPSSAYIFGNLRKSAFPYGVWVMPFGSDKVHKVRVNSPLRCTRCKAYVNAYFRFDGTKNNAVCNICGISFAIDRSHVDPNNLNSTEIATQGVIDFVVKDSVFVKKRVDIIKVVMAFEISNFMIEANAFSTIIQSTKAAIQNTQFQKNIRIGFILFNGQSIIYPKLAKTANFAQKVPTKYTVKYSSQGLCCPLSDEQLLFNPNTQKQQILHLLNCISDIAEQQHKNSKYTTQGANYIGVIKSLLANFNNQVGRVIIFSHTAPRTGIMPLRVRNQEDNKVPLKPLGLEYFQLSRELAKARVGIQIIGQSGTAYHSFLGFTHRRQHPFKQLCVYLSHSQNLYYNVYGALTRKYVYDINFTSRFSNSLNVHSFGIGDSIHQTRDITLGTFDPQNSISVNFQQQQKIQQSSSSFVQFAMMFTNGDGERIIRIINYRFQITNRVQVLHQASDCLAFANLVLRQVTHRMVRGQAAKAREEAIGRLIGILGEYVQEAGNKVKISSFMAHPNLAPAFAYIHSFLDSKIFMNSLKVPADYQILEALKVNLSGFFNFSNFFYPKLFSLGMEIYQNSPVPGDLIQGQGDIEQSVVLPPSLPLTAQSITKEGLYLHWSSDYLLILVQPECPSETLIELFNTDNWDQLEEMNALPELQTAHNIRIGMIIEELRRRTSRNNGIFLPLLIRTAKKKGPYNDLLNMVLKEDYLEFKYFTFLDTIHRNVQTKIK